MVEKLKFKLVKAGWEASDHYSLWAKGDVSSYSQYKWGAGTEKD
jgi:hypothetical protein